MSMTVQEWEVRLRETFGADGVVGPSLLSIHLAEEAFDHYVASTFSGYRVLNQSFLEFFHRSLRKAQAVARATGSATASNSYGATLLFYANIFTRFRAAEVLFLNGYPLDAYALLRDLKDRAIYLSGVIAGITSVVELFGLGGESGPGDDWERRRNVVRLRRGVQRRVKDHITGDNSGLDDEVVNLLRRWESLFDEEVHLSTFTFSLESDSWEGEDPRLPIGPQTKKASVALYTNRSWEISWLLLRTFPYLQPAPPGFGVDWKNEWDILDDSMRYAVLSLAERGQPVTEAVIALVSSKFNFDPSMGYEERWTGS